MAEQDLLQDQAEMQEPTAETQQQPVMLPSLATRVEWFEDWEEKTLNAQREARIDRDFHDNDQWTNEEKAVLRSRGQPIITKNRIARKVHFTIGEEIRKRVDPSARPRNPQHEDSARAATDALRFAEEEEKFDRVRSAVFKNMLIEGYAGALKTMKVAKTGDPSHPIRYVHKLEHIEWDRLFYDPADRTALFENCKYKGIVMWVDFDDAVTRYPHARRQLEAAMNQEHTSSYSSTTDDTPRGHQWADSRRKRIKIVEMYFAIEDENGDKDWYRSLFTRFADIDPPEQTFIRDELGLHSLCPLTMVSCYIDANGMRYGIVRAMRSPQEEINKRSSKMMHLLNQERVIAEEGAIRDEHKFQAERAKPDGFIKVAPNALIQGRLKVDNNLDVAQGHMMMLQEAKQDIDASGPSSSALPAMSAATSGRAFLARQQAASQELGSVFDQLSWWTHEVFQLDWCCIRQFWTDETWLRVRDDARLDGYRFTALNQRMTRAQRYAEVMQKAQPPIPPEQGVAIAAGDMAPMILAEVNGLAQQMQMQAQMQLMMQAQQAGPMPPGAMPPGAPPGGGPPGMPPQMPQVPPPDINALIMQHPLMQQPIVLNQVDQMLIDILIEEAPETAVLADEQFEIFSNLALSIIQARPDLAEFVTKTMLKLSAYRNKREIIEEMERGPNPQQQQMQAQIQQLQMAMQQMQLALGQSKVQLQQAQAAKTSAEAQAVPIKSQNETAATRSSANADAVDNALKAERLRLESMPKAMIIANAVPRRGTGGMPPM